MNSMAKPLNKSADYGAKEIDKSKMGFLGMSGGFEFMRKLAVNFMIATILLCFLFFYVIPCFSYYAFPFVVFVY